MSLPIVKKVPRMTRCHRAAVIVGLLNLFAAILLPAPARAGDPTEQVRRTVDKVLTIVRSSPPTSKAQMATRRVQLAEVIYPRFDFAEMAKRSLGDHWAGRRRDEQFATMVEKAIEHGKPVRIGVNWGSLDPELLARMMDANARLLRNDIVKKLQKVLTAARVDPEVALTAKMKPARARRHPDLATRRLAVDDNLGAARELDLENTVRGLELQIQTACFQRALDGEQHRVHQGIEFGFSHPVLPSFEFD